MIDVYWLGDINVGVSANTSSGRVTIHETKKKFQYRSLIISALVVGVLWVIANEIPTALRENLSQCLC